MKLLNYALLFAGIYLLYYVYLGYTEGFTNMTFGTYSCSSESPILRDSFYEKKNPDLSDLNNENNFDTFNDTQVPMSSYVQETNNKKYWNTPDNGECSPADFCGSLYTYTPYEIEPLKIPNDKSARVNFYNV